MSVINVLNWHSLALPISCSKKGILRVIVLVIALLLGTGLAIRFQD